MFCLSVMFFVVFAISGFVFTNGYYSTNCHNNVCSACNSYACRIIRRGETPNLPKDPNASRNLMMSQHGVDGCEYSMCPADCEGYVLVQQSKRGKQCPICKCSGYGVTKPCSGGNDCDSGNCMEDRGFCRYPEPKGKILTECAFDADCPSTEECTSGFCLQGSGNKPPHLEGTTCVFEHECPSKMYCKDMTCYEQGGPNSQSNRPPHLQGVSCVFEKDCPSSMHCQKMTCYEGTSTGNTNRGSGSNTGSNRGGGSNSGNRGRGGNSGGNQGGGGANNGNQGQNLGRGGNAGGNHGGGSRPLHLQGVSCTFEHECPADMSCNNRDMTCYEKTGPRHEPGISCVFTHQCSKGYTCDKGQMTCFEGGPDSDHGGQCVFDKECASGYRCKDMTCMR